MGTDADSNVLLTWKDVATQADDLEGDMRGLLLEIVDSKESATDQAGGADGPWFLIKVEVQGHVGIGEVAVPLTFAATHGITVVSGRNGTGKTSVADAMRYNLSNRRARTYELAERNIHYGKRAITVVITNGLHEVEIICDGDSAVRWREVSGAEGPIPAGWIAAFERYMPILLYPEISPIIEKPGTLHEFLKGALELGVLEELLRDVDAIRKQGRETQAKVKSAHESTVEGIRKLGATTLLADLTTVGPMPQPDEYERLRRTATDLPLNAPPQIELATTWSVDEAAGSKTVAAILRLEKANAGVIAGAAAVQAALDKLLRADGPYTADLRDRDVCPVCKTPGADWFTTATTEATALRRLLSEVRAAEKALEKEIDQLRSCLPQILPTRTRQALVDLDDAQAGARIEQWQTLAAQAVALSAGTATVAGVEKLLAAATDLAAWYATTRSSILSSRDVSLTEQAKLRTYVDGWLNVFDGSRSTLKRAATADRLADKIELWIKNTRASIFEPIAGQVMDIWKTLTSDTDLVLTNISLGGGVRQARKVNLDLSAGGTPVPSGTNNAAVLSTGQRNALSLATYLPRATQPQSPFRFLVLDDPIHVFDSWRVRYLAKYLVSLADRYQIVVFTHDDRLWRQLRALGYRATHLRLDRPVGGQSYVRVKDRSRPGEQLLSEIQTVLNQEDGEALGTPAARAAMTLALCRQAVDTEVTTQMEIIGHRLGLAENAIQSDLDRARKTRDQLDLLNSYARRAGLNSVNYGPYEQTITALNAGAHGRSPAAATQQQCREWVRQCGRLVQRVHSIVG